MTNPLNRRLAGVFIVLLLSCAALSGCSTTRSTTALGKASSHGKLETDFQMSAAALNRKARDLYQRAHHLLVTKEFKLAIRVYNKVISQYPFTPYAIQSQLELAYAYYRSPDPEDATTTVDRFIHQHPRNPNIAYAYYLKGLIAESRQRGLLYLLPISLPSEQYDPSSKKQAFHDFALLLRRYPHSRYAGDARRRMIFLRNRIADHQLAIVLFYIHRGAWLAAARRAEGIISNYPGAPATGAALLALKRCDNKLGLKDQERQVDALISANSHSLRLAKVRKPAPKAASGGTPANPAAPATSPNSQESSLAKSLFARFL